MFSAQFTHIMIAYTFSTISPGADLAMIIRQSILQGRRHAILTALGVGAAVFVHISYTILGLGLLISTSPLAFNILKWAGSLYLLYIGISAFFTGKIDTNFDKEKGEKQKKQSYVKAFFMGLAVDLLNPQAVFFFLSIFSLLIQTDTSFLIQFWYGVLMAVMVFAWFVFITYIITSAALKEKFIRASRWINWISGLYFIFLSIDLMLQTRV